MSMGSMLVMQSNNPVVTGNAIAVFLTLVQVDISSDEMLGPRSDALLGEGSFGELWKLGKGILM